MKFLFSDYCIVLLLYVLHTSSIILGEMFKYQPEVTSN